MELRRRLRVGAFIALATVAQIVSIVFGVSVLLQGSPATAAQSVPYKVNFQGRLSDSSGNVLSDGLYNVKFRLWTLSSGGSNQWEGDRVRGASDYRIQVTNGLFNIQFGDTTLGDPAITPSLFNTGSGALYLEVELPTPATATCATNGCATFTEGAMTPRQPLASSPYAINSDSLDGLDSSAFGQIAATNTYTAANIFAPTASSVIALTVKATTAGSTNSLEVFDSGGTRQAYFDATGNLNVVRTIQPTANNAVDLGTSGASFRTGYFATSIITPSVTTASNAALTIDAGTGTLSLGTSANNKSITIGATATTNNTTAINIGNTTSAGGASTIQIGGTGANNGSNAGTTVTVQAGQTSFITGNTGAAVQTYSNSATAFQVLNSAGAADLTANSITGMVTINQGGLTVTGLNNPATPTLASVGTTGTLAAATYTYLLSATSGAGETQAIATSPVNVLTTGTTSKNTLTWAAVTNATGYKLYRSTNGGTTWFVNTLGAVTTAVDNGSNFAWATGSTPSLYENHTGDITLNTGTSLMLDPTTNGRLKYDGINKTTVLSSYATGGVISLQADSLNFQDTTSYNSNLLISNTGATTFKNRVDSAAALSVQNNSSKNILAIDTSGNQVLLGHAGTGGVNGKLTFNSSNASSYTSSFSASASQAATIDYTLPTALTTNGFLTTNNSGALSWSTSGANLTSLDPSNFTTGSGAISVVSAAATALTLNSGTSGGISIGTQGTGKTIQIGQTTVGVTDTIGIGNSSFAGSVDNVTIGNLLTTSTTAIQGGTNAANAITLTAGANGGIAATTTGTGNIALNTASSVIVQSTSDSAKTFQVQNAASSAIFNINTTDTNPISKSGFESAVLTPWANLTGGTLTQDLTQHYVGFAAGKVTAGTSAGGGISQPNTLTISTQYTLSFYAKLDAASAAFSTLQAGYSSTGAVGGEVDCALSSSTVISAGWNRYICTFTTPGTSSGTPYIYIQHSDTTSEVFYVDAVQLDTGSIATPYGSGQISLNANINSPVNFQQSANSSTAFQITNTTGTNILNVDTLNNNLSNQATNPSFESGTTGWAARAGCTFTQDATGGYNGTSSGNCANTATANAGMNMTGIVPVMVNGTTYTMSMYVKASANMTTLEIGRADNGAADTACLTAQSVSSTGWKRFTCTFTAGAQSGTPYIYVKQTDATVRTIWVDAVTLETDANASTNYRDGRISLGNATISSPAVFQTNANSTTAFQIQNAGGIQVFNVDTASDTGLVDNSGFEVNSTGWAIRNGATNLVRDTSKTYVGIASGKVTTAVTAGSGLRYTFPTQLPAAFYTISAYVQTSGADAGFNMGYNNGADTACTIAPVASATIPSTTGWTRFVCTTGTSAVLNSIYISSGSQVVTLNVDGVRVEAGTTVTAFGNSNISFNGVFTSPINIRSPNDTTTEFQVQSSASVNLLSVDSLNKTITVGSGTTDTTQVLFQVDSFSTFAETATCSTTANQGSMYYNSTANVIRVCVNGAWEDMVSTAGLGLQLFGIVPDTGTNPGDLASVTGTNIAGPCKVAVGATTSTVSWTACTAYSGGRKNLITAGTTTTSGTGAVNTWQHLCISSTTGQPVLSASRGTEVAGLATESMPSVTAPNLCLADIKMANNNNPAISIIYDTRTYTTSTKETVSIGTTAPGLGYLVQYTTTRGTVIPMATANGNNLAGVVVATTGSFSSTVINGIIAVSGPASVKTITGINTVGTYIFGSGTAGYATGVATKPAETTATIYNMLGVFRTAWTGGTACSLNADACAGSVLTSIDKR